MRFQVSFANFGVDKYKEMYVLREINTPEESVIYKYKAARKRIVWWLVEEFRIVGRAGDQSGLKLD